MNTAEAFNMLRDLEEDMDQCGTSLSSKMRRATDVLAEALNQQGKPVQTNEELPSTPVTDETFNRPDCGLDVAFNVAKDMARLEGVAICLEVLQRLDAEANGQHTYYAHAAMQIQQLVEAG